MASSGRGELLDRISTLLLLAIVGMALFAFGNALRKPYADGLSMRQKIADTQVEVDRLRVQNDRLGAEARYLKTERGLEIEARRQSYVHPWETPVRIVVRDGEETGAQERDTSRSR
jgi:hypothetical protein